MWTKRHSQNTFLKQFTRFETMARVSDEDVPRNPHND